jgi:ADP-heptose:LPS heptosyltransferase
VKILAIRLARLGDVILLLPALAYLKEKFSGSELTLLTGHRCAPAAELCPAIDRVMSVDRIAMRDGPVWHALRDMGALVREVRKQEFDMVVDFHSFRETNLLTWLSGAPVRIGMKRYQAPYLRFCFNRPPILEDKSLHVAHMFHRVVSELSESGRSVGPPQQGAVGIPAFGKLVVVKAKVPTIALFVDAPVPERIWPAERFAAVSDFAVEKLEASVIVLSSKDRADQARQVLAAARYPDRLTVFTDLTLAELAGVIASAHLLVSNDTGPMHIGPAVGVHTLGLFSVGYPEHFKPIGAEDRYLRGNPIEAIEVRDVVAAVGAMWTRAYRDLRR